MITHIFDASPISLTCWFLLVIFSFPACGGNIYINDFNPSGYTSSPNYPSNYPQHADCVWTITAPNGHAVELQFEDQFYIEPSSKYTTTLFCLCFFRDSILVPLSLLLSLIPPRAHFQIYNQKWLGNFWERSLKLSGCWYTFLGLCSAWQKLIQQTETKHPW